MWLALHELPHPSQLVLVRLHQLERPGVALRLLVQVDKLLAAVRQNVAQLGDRRVLAVKLDGHLPNVLLDGTKLTPPFGHACHTIGRPAAKGEDRGQGYAATRVPYSPLGVTRFMEPMKSAAEAV